MSSRFTIICRTCEVDGPHIIRRHQRAWLQESDVPRFFGQSDQQEATEEWGAFLLEHEYHELEMATERGSQLAREKRERNKRPLPTHMMLSDGSLVELTVGSRRRVYPPDRA